MAVRIKGLVRGFNDIRAQLQAGIRPDQEEQFRGHVRALTAGVEEICAAHGTTIESLPSPTRRAYSFLKDLDTRDLPPPSGARTTTAVPRLRIANVVKGAGMFSKRMWDDLPGLFESKCDRDGLASEMLDFVSGIEEVCSQSGTMPDSLEAPSRRAYGWLKFLLTEDNLLLHLAALNRGQSAVLRLNPRPDRVELYLANMNSIWRRRSRGELALLKVNEGFLHADDRVWQGLINSALKKHDGKGGGIVDEYTDSEEFSGVLYEIESFTEMRSTSPGHAHNLDESFDRVNTAYFAGNLAKPRLRWNRVLTARTFGHFNFSRNTMMLSVSLDDPAVPESVVDYVMYHELLHKKHGVKLVNGRRLAHTSAFRKDEQSFKGYDDATSRLNALAKKHGSR